MSLRDEVKPVTQPYANLVVGKPETEPKSLKELAARAKPRSCTTPVEPKDPGDWT